MTMKELSERVESNETMGAIRYALGMATVPVLKLTGYRYSKRFRHGATPLHALAYCLIDTVHANLKAGMNEELS